LADVDERRGEVDEIAAPLARRARRRVGVAGGAAPRQHRRRAVVERWERLGCRIRFGVLLEQRPRRGDPDAVVHPVTSGDEVEEGRTARRLRGDGLGEWWQGDVLDRRRGLDDVSRHHGHAETACAHDAGPDVGPRCRPRAGEDHHVVRRARQAMFDPRPRGRPRQQRQ
jgi:hypothetical protein